MRCAIAFFLLFLSCIPPCLTASTPAPAARARALRAWGALPLAFEENRGQFPRPHSLCRARAVLLCIG